jgi:hypothetical protein
MERRVASGSANPLDGLVNPYKTTVALVKRDERLRGGVVLEDGAKMRANMRCGLDKWFAMAQK